MIRVMASFLLGLLVGSGALFLASRAYLLIAEGSEMTAANERGMSLPEYQQWVDSRYERPFLVFSMVGGLMCAWCSAYAAWRSENAAARRPVHRRRRLGSDDPLTREEFHQVLQACLLVPLDERSSEYVRGLVVGRLAEASPAVARKVDGFNDRHMAALHSDLRHRQNRLSRGVRG